MKKNTILLFLMLCSNILGVGCKKQIETKIYGTVFNKETHETVMGAQIDFGIYERGSSHADFKVFRSICSTVSGYDGQYEVVFGKLPELDYSELFQVRVSAYGFNDLILDANPLEGYPNKIDVNLTKNPY